MSRSKYSKEFKLQMIREHEAGATYYSLEKKHGIVLGTISRWESNYMVHGEAALEQQNCTMCRYTAEFKKKVVEDYVSGGGSIANIAVKYGIYAESTVSSWIRQYNSHEELTDSRPEGGRCLMAKDIEPRKTALEERIKIVEHCISNSNNYASTAQEYSCSYGQVYSWVKKYNENGVDGLKDGRGRNRNESEMTEVEKLRAENRLLRAEKKKQQMEIDLLKKIEAIERR